MGVRRYSCFLFQIGIVAYILGAAFYLLGRNTNISVTSANKSIWESLNKYHSNRPFDIPKYDPDYNEQPRSYVIDPPNYPFKMKVDLPVATNNTKRQAAAFIVLVRNSELFGMVQSMQDVGKALLNFILDDKGY